MRDSIRAGMIRGFCVNMFQSYYIARRISWRYKLPEVCV